MAYNFKSIGSVPTAKDFIDIVLSRTQRQTPTVVHRGYAITRIRAFYMRKVKYTQQVWHEKLAKILEEFPRVDDCHPFYADLMNVLYDKDHYKLALGQVNMARNLIDRIARDYVKLLKYGDSLYRCKALKRAALGRMCTLMRKQSASLAYLEQVRQHLARLPSIDPSTRTILVCGYPNVGKSSFMNVVTRADVEVQPYAFTTKSLFVGHTDHGYLRWQVIDTPGILDRPLEERNTIEMQSITALAHLRCCVLYIVDISEQCGYSIAQQAALFESIKPLFANKPLVVAFNKSDVRPLSALPASDLQLLRALAASSASGCGVLPSPTDQAALEAAGGGDSSLQALTMSTLNEAGVSAVKAACCDKLLAHRVDTKLRGKRAGAALQRVYVAVPGGAAGGGDASAPASRPPCIPSSVSAARAAVAAASTALPPPRRRTEKDEQEEHGGAGVYRADLCKPYLLADEGWKHDIVPEFLDGKNVFDFVDADIEQRLAELEAEEEAAEAEYEASRQGGEAMEGEEGDDAPLTEEEAALLTRIRGRKARLVHDHRRAKSAADNAPVVPRRANTGSKLTTSSMAEGLAGMGMDPSRAVERARGRSASRMGRNGALGKRGRSLGDAAEGMAVDGEDVPAAKRVHSNRSRSVSRKGYAPEAVPGEGFKDTPQKAKAQKMADRSQRRMNSLAKAGEADRVILTKMPKHLFSGKRSNGKTDWR